MRLLVLGGTGLISTAIVNRLVAEKHVPVLFNRGVTKSRVAGDVETIVGDRSDFKAFAAAMRGVKVDAVIDMITYDAKTATNSVRVFGGKVSHYVFCSTVCVYGGPLTEHPADESEPHRPVSDYGRNKSQAEATFMNAHGDSGFPVTTMRPSHCYGPGRALLGIWGYDRSLVTRLRKGKPILVPGDGQGLWQPGYIDDMAKGFVGALGRKATLGKAYNIVGDEIMTWHDFHARMARAIGCKADIVPMTTAQLAAGSPPGTSTMLTEIFQFHAAYSGDALKRDVPAYRNLLPWEEGVRRTVAWLDENKVHAPANLYPWVDALAAEARRFERALTVKRREFAKGDSRTGRPRRSLRD